MGFSNNFVDLGFSRKDRLETIINKMSRLPFAGTDCSLPMVYATQHNIEVDTFVVITDNETWAGRIHPKQALDRYRDKTGIPARVVVLAMTPTKFSIADPNDPGMLDVAGFDTATPRIIRDFSAGLI